MLGGSTSERLQDWQPGRLKASIYPPHRHTPTRCPSPACVDGNHMMLISCPELLKHFLFQINSNKQAAEPGIGRATRQSDSVLPAELLAGPKKKSLGVLPLRTSFKCTRSADRLFKCYILADLVPTLTHQLSCGWESSQALFFPRCTHCNVLFLESLQRRVKGSALCFGRLCSPCHRGTSSNPMPVVNSRKAENKHTNQPEHLHFIAPVLANMHQDTKDGKEEY